MRGKIGFLVFLVLSSPWPSNHTICMYVCVYIYTSLYMGKERCGTACLQGPRGYPFGWVPPLCFVYIYIYMNNQKPIFPRVIYRKDNIDVVSANHCFFGFIGTVTAFFGFLLVYFGFIGTVVTFSFKNQKKLRFLKLLLTKTNKSYDVTKKTKNSLLWFWSPHSVCKSLFFWFYWYCHSFFWFFIGLFCFFWYCLAVLVFAIEKHWFSLGFLGLYIEIYTILKYF